MFRPPKREKCGPQSCTLGPGGSECRTVDVCVSPGSHGKTISQPPVVRPSRFGSYITKPLFAWIHSERKEDNENERGRLQRQHSQISQDTGGERPTRDRKSCP